MRTRQLHRLANRLLLDPVDAARRAVSGQRHWPPLSLRRWIGSRGDFDADGRWFIDQLLHRELLAPGTRILDIGCGCGRLAVALARDPRVLELDLVYCGLDVDRLSIDWCRRNLPDSGFDFRHLDLRNRSYNPRGPIDPAEYTFPFDDASYDLVIAASLFTHLLPEAMARYLGEMARLLTEGGTLWATFFLQQTVGGASDRHPLDFPHRHGPAAIHSREDPERAIAFDERHVLELAAEADLALGEPIAYGPHDHLFLVKAP